jgi:HAD superfamily hydrolase (TIGR01509 family)
VSAAAAASIRGVIFDMDGVLCDSEPFIAAAAIEMFRQNYGISATRGDFAPFVGAGEDRFIGGVAEKYGVKLSVPRDKARTYELYLEMIKGKLQPLPGAVQFIHDCRGRGLRIAVATSADRVKLVGNLAQIGVPAETFDAIVTGDDVERKKPDPQIFLLAATRLNLAPVNCLVIEDATNGIRAGKGAGSRCLGITTTFDAAALRNCGADFIAPDLAHVPPEALA